MTEVVSCHTPHSTGTVDPNITIKTSEPISKRAKHGAVTGSMLETLENLEHCVVPPYLKDVQTWRAYAKAKAAVEYQSMMRTTKELDDVRNIKRWKVQDVNPNAWRQNLIDQRMIYSKNDVIIADAIELPPTSRPNTPEQEVPRENSYLKVEKNYILGTKHRVRTPVNMTAKRLMTQTMKHFNKPSASPESKYCTPRTKLYVEELIPRPPKFEVVTNFPMGVTRWARRHEGTICTHNREQSLGQYCDVLGPYVCKKCIEVTNRRIIAEIQKETFPELEFSVTTLVAPKLARAMSKGDSMMSREPSREPSRNTAYGTSAGGILKFPVVEPSKINPKDFKRAGIERRWYNRSRTFHFENETPVTRNDELRNSADSQRRPKTKSGTRRSVTISPVKTIH